MPLGLPTADEARHRGARLGEEHATIWDPDEVVVQRISDDLTAWLRAHAVRRSNAQRLWIAVMVVCIVVALAGIAAVGLWMWLPDAGVALPVLSAQTLAIAAVTWLVAVLGVVIAIIGNAISRTIAARRRISLLADHHALALREALLRVDNRRIAARTFGNLPPAPGPQTYGISERGAVELASAWLRHLGFAPAISPVRVDGIDIRFGPCLARVTGRDEDAAASVRELAGAVAAHPHARGIAFFTSAPGEGVTLFADRAGIAVLVMDAVAGSLHGANLEGREVMKAARRSPAQAVTAP
ncbi:hypothetical protein ACFQRL_03515 [Microbacterium fluvii]|uniref:Restriction endonuclease type IV Mrr domain-containing protein n=1 Tax=Microbacterium fluvii TaxID=415215 RepID=A0ABW2HB00_9MICO|nr:hypothetical protein [Microbacterium fluvii]MCU4671664.1 hypothetical protein [Microbacterium fluvii]